MRRAISFSIALVALMGAIAYGLRPTEIRVRNASDVEFKSVSVKDKQYGDIPPGGTTDYQVWEEAYLSERVSLSVNSTTLTYHIHDHMGERALGAGKFTYVIRRGWSGQIGILAERDVN
jgi:hypothetical protein